MGMTWYFRLPHGAFRRDVTTTNPWNGLLIRLHFRDALMLDCAISYFLESVSHKLNFFLFPAYLLSYTFVTETHKPDLKKKKKKNQPLYDWK